MSLASHVPDNSEAAPTTAVRQRKVVAIEHPAAIVNLDKGLRTFGTNPNFGQAVEPKAPAQILPIWFRPDNPSSKPLPSQHAPSHNLLLKITVPKRTGRKRKRGSDAPFTDDPAAPGQPSKDDQATSDVCSSSRKDSPQSLLRRLQDNVGRYDTEVAGVIKDTYRYRGLADHQFSNKSYPFMAKVAEHLLPMQVSKLRQFQLEPGVDARHNLEIIPPPQFTDKLVSFNYSYEQNPYIQQAGVDEEGAPVVVNTQGRNKLSYGHFIHHDDYPVPTGPKRQLDRLPNHVREELMAKVRNAMEERPIWTRRSLLNHLGDGYTDTAVKIAIQLVGYQFRGGPWRDAIIKYGVDPRQDPNCYIYQTLAFKLQRNAVGSMKMPWQAIRRGQTTNATKHLNRESHYWDGESYCTDGKFWQVCDITDAYLAKKIAEAPKRAECDSLDSGWLHRCFWGKVKAFMKAKMVAIKHGRVGSDSDDPRKPGFIYNDYLFEKMKHIPDDSDDKTTTVSMDTLLYPMMDLKGVKRPRARPTRLSLPANSKQKRQSAARNEKSADPGDVSGNKGDESHEQTPEGMVIDNDGDLDGPDDMNAAQQGWISDIDDMDDDDVEREGQDSENEFEEDLDDEGN